MQLIYKLLLISLMVGVAGFVLPINNETTTNQSLGLNIVVNNTNLAPSFAGESTGTGQRVTGTTYFNNNSDIELFVISHGSSTANTSEIHLFINGTKVADTSGKPLAIAEQNNRSITAIIPRSSSYMLEFNNYHHYEWREYRILSGNSTNDLSSYLPLSGGVMNGSLNMNSNNIYYPTLIYSGTLFSSYYGETTGKQYGFSIFPYYENAVYISAGYQFTENYMKMNTTETVFNKTIIVNNNNITDINTLTLNNGMTIYNSSNPWCIMIATNGSLYTTLGKC